MQHNDDPIYDRLVTEVRLALTAAPACHDWDHTCRVLGHARRLAQVEGADPRVVAYAALLHDIGRPEELADQGQTCHARLGARRTREKLPQLGVTDTGLIEHVAHCVGAHRYRKRHGEAPRTLEARVIYDADKLDAIGAVGIGRAFHFAGRVGARLHNTCAEALASDSYSREDTAYREYLVKLRDLHTRMLTDEGRRVAAARQVYMAGFFAQLEREMRGEDFA